MTSSATRESATEGMSLTDVTVTFPTPEGGSRNILDEFSIEARPGEFLVLIGRSGCGKTTVLNLLAGLLTENSGRVSVLGTTPRAARSRLGYMFARDALLPFRTATGNVELGLEVRGVPRAERRRRAINLLDRLGLSHAKSLYPWQLSQGMRQRVALARTWATQPKLILMDEPFAALDAQTRESVRSEFLAMWERERSAVVFVTHDLNEALLMGDRVVVMGTGGKVVADVELPFSRPRDASELPFTEEFRALERRLHHLLQDVDHGTAAK
ncbi:ABC transporter ATP-binding protein [Diaminobutyricimonas sp. LJ205]|uniref:ABC transporter ATP-binding protein n=1 Tax=Diaminobutyricimonas sp. LJ205 TaxID=2683590 RepID=UPI0012F4FBA6|nr:ABC transporter ATP-binding protein [Diaminobutyricimonas sp. LJ205]